MAQQEVQNGGAEKIAAAGAVSVISVKPQLLVEAPKASDAIRFYKSAFGAEEVSRTLHPKRKADQELPLVLSALLKLGSSTILVSDDTAIPLTSAKGAGSGVVLFLETHNVEAAISKAVSSGAVVVEGEAVEGEGECCGSRVGMVKDPYGIVWQVCSPVKECAEAEA